MAPPQPSQAAGRTGRNGLAWRVGQPQRLLAQAQHLAESAADSREWGDQQAAVEAFWNSHRKPIVLLPCSETQAYVAALREVPRLQAVLHCRSADGADELT